MYWVIYLAYFPIALLLTYIIAKMVLKEYQDRVKINYPYHKTDIKWNLEILVKYPFYAFFGGVMAGLLGIGGGLILGPLLLELGIHPLISTATSNFLVLFTSSSTTLQFILLGMMNFHYGFVCTIASTMGSYIGTLVIQNLIQKTGRSSILIFSLALVLGVSTIFIPAHTLMDINHKVKEGLNIWIFNSPC
jgi:uncharacterized membrane protein YfcA